MPTYEYDCAACGPFDALRPIARRDEPAPCPACGAIAPRVLLSAPALAGVGGQQAAGRRMAMARNERAAHSPHSTRDAGNYRRMNHPAGCGCCRPAGRSVTVTARDGSRSAPSRRPWMISH